MKKLLTLVLLLPGAVFACHATTLSSDFAKNWFDYKARKFSLAKKEYKKMAELTDNKDLKKRYKKIADKFGDLKKQFKKLVPLVPVTGIMVSTENKDQWKVLKQEGQSLMAQKEKELQLRRSLMRRR